MNQPIGCDACYQCSAEAADAARRRFLEVRRLVDESHFIVRIIACPGCGQAYISVFTETIDWKDGDDAQYWSLLPVSPKESAELWARGETLVARGAESELVAFIESLGRKRRHLQVDHPTGGPTRVRWADGGLHIGPHD
jgi:hypothetical protein